MSMYPDSENFEQLRRLLALKRHEQPPPGYFSNFSSQVCARIKAGERASDPGFFGLFSNSYWLQRIWASLERQPVMAGALGMAACVFLLAGILYTTEKSDMPQQAYLPNPTPSLAASGGLRIRPAQDSFRPP